MNQIRSLLLPVLLLFAAIVPAWGQEANEPAITPSVLPAQGLVRFLIHVKDKTHITDRKNGFFKVELAPNDFVEIGAVRFPAAVPYEDEMVYRGGVQVEVPLLSKQKLEKPLPLSFTVSYQICQEEPEALCYAPSSQTVSVTLDPLFAGAVRKRSWIARIQGFFAGDPRQRLLPISLLLVLLGFVTSLTPCVYPVIPIVMGYVGSRSQGRKGRGFVLSAFFAAGLALVYSLLGVVAALTGSMLGATFQNPWMVGAVAAIFILMGLSMAGLFTITPPASLASRLGGGQGGSALGAFVIGGVSAVVAAPCAGPVIIALLSWIAQTRNLPLGFFFMLLFSLGMSVIFLLVGTFSGVVSSLPRGGKWMAGVKYLFAVLLVGAGVYFLATISPHWLARAEWGIFLLGLALFGGLFSPMAAGDVRAKALRLLLLVAALVGALLFWKGLEVRFFPRVAARSVEAQAGILPWQADLERALATAKSEKRRVLVDTYADWCAACKELEAKTYSRPEVASALRGYILVKLDFTQSGSSQSRALAQRFRIVGNPTVIVMGPDGSEISRFSGYKSAPEFLEFLRALPAMGPTRP